MDKLLAIQCFVKHDTLKVLLNYLSQCVDRENYSVVFAIDSCVDMPYENRDHWYENNAIVNELLNDYKNQKYHKETIIIKNKNNHGPFVTCYNLISYCMNMSDFIIFLEDDMLLSKDALIFYQKSYEFLKDNAELFAISTTSVTNSTDKKDLYKLQKCNWVGSSEFAVTKKTWEKYGYLRGNKTAGDVDFGYACRNNNMYTFSPLVSRARRIGFYHNDSYSSYYHNKFYNQNFEYEPDSNKFDINYEEKLSLI
jgi:hypothetical protein